STFSSFLTSTATLHLYPLPYTTLFRSVSLNFAAPWISQQLSRAINRPVDVQGALYLDWERVARYDDWRAHVPMSILRVHDIRVRSEEHTSELQSRENLVCRLLLEKKNT